MASKPQPNALAKVNRDLKKFRNLPDEGHIMGVCAGIAYWRGWPTWVVRLAFLALVFGAGVGILAYLIIGFVAPDADTPADYGKRTGDA